MTITSCHAGQIPNLNIAQGQQIRHTRHKSSTYIEDGAQQQCDYVLVIKLLKHIKEILVTLSNSLNMRLNARLYHDNHSYQKLQSTYIQDAIN